MLLFVTLIVQQKRGRRRKEEGTKRTSEVSTTTILYNQTNIYFFSLGAIISSGLTISSNFSELRASSSMALSLSVMPFL